MKRVGIDARFYGPIGKGLGRYTQEVVDNIIKINEQKNNESFHYVVFLGPKNFDHLDIKSDKVEKVKVSCKWYSLAEQISMPIEIKKAKIDLMHFPHFNVPLFVPSKFVVTIHDLILTHFPTVRATTKGRLTYFIKNLAYRLILRHALRSSEKIITVSNFTKEDILNKFNVEKEKVVVTYEGLSDLSDDRNFKKEIVVGNDNHRLPDKFILYIGSAYPHKNLEILLDVFKELKERGSNIYLVLVGGNDYFYERLKKEAERKCLYKDGDINNRVIFTGYVADNYLVNLYKNARAYIFPSMYEGFGLPPLEAMNYSCPVLSSDQASLPEILGEAALFFNPKEKDEIKNSIEKIDSDENLRKSLIAKGLEQIKKYSWEVCAKETRDVYLNILGEND